MKPGLQEGQCCGTCVHSIVRYLCDEGPWYACAKDSPCPPHQDDGVDSNGKEFDWTKFDNPEWCKREEAHEGWWDANKVQPYNICAQYLRAPEGTKE